MRWRVSIKDARVVIDAVIIDVEDFWQVGMHEDGGVFRDAVNVAIVARHGTASLIGYVTGVFLHFLGSK